jgi:hypothetical protein
LLRREAAESLVSADPDRNKILVIWCSAAFNVPGKRVESPSRLGQSVRPGHTPESSLILALALALDGFGGARW